MTPISHAPAASNTDAITAPEPPPNRVLPLARARENDGLNVTTAVGPWLVRRTPMASAATADKPWEVHRTTCDEPCDGGSLRRFTVRLAARCGGQPVIGVRHDQLALELCQYGQHPEHGADRGTEPHRLAATPDHLGRARLRLRRRGTAAAVLCAATLAAQGNVGQVDAAELRVLGHHAAYRAEQSPGRSLDGRRSAAYLF
ncbi:hypothetical protein [Streptomyces sp. NPDC001153]